MKAARLHAYADHFERALQVEDVPEPVIAGPLDVIVRVGAAGLCRTDLHIIEGQWQQKISPELPYVLGHETAGWVAEIGSGVTNVAVGDAVILHPLASCGTCEACRRGHDMQCSQSLFPGVAIDGGFADFVLTNARSLVPLGDSIHPKQVAALADAGLTAYHAVKKAVASLVPGTRAVVVGAGGLGHIGIQVLAALTATDIIVIDKSAAALELAKQWGAHHAVLADGGQVDAVRELSDGQGVEAVFDFVGEGTAVAESLAMVRPAGDYYCIGYGGAIEIPTIDVVFSEISMHGNLVGTYPDLVELMALTSRGLVKLHTTEYPLAEINDAIAALASGQIRGRAVLVP